MALLDGSQGGLHMGPGRGGDNYRVDLGPGDQFAEIVGEKIRADIVFQLFAQRLVHVGQADPADAGKILGQGGAHPPDHTAADNGQSQLFFIRHLFHPFMCLIVVPLPSYSRSDPICGWLTV